MAYLCMKRETQIDEIIKRTEIGNNCETEISVLQRLYDVPHVELRLAREEKNIVEKRESLKSFRRRITKKFNLVAAMLFWNCSVVYRFT